MYKQIYKHNKNSNNNNEKKEEKSTTTAVMTTYEKRDKNGTVTASASGDRGEEGRWRDREVTGGAGVT